MSATHDKSEEMTGCHELKAWPEAFDAVWSGDKPFEYRPDDRNFQPGDWVRLRRWDPVTEQYTGPEITADIGFVLRAPAFGVPKGFCVFGLLDVNNWPHGVNY